MPRIPDAAVERLRTEIDLVPLIEADGLMLKKVGKDFACACPFHDGDREPSLIVSPDKNLFHCFACGAAGSPIDWVMRRRGVAFRRAVELLRAQASSDVVSSTTAGPTLPRAAASRVGVPLPPCADDAALLDEVIGFYHQTLRTAPEALAYLAKRGLTHPEVIDHFKLGYANRTLAYRLPEKQVQAGAKLRGQLQRLGVLRASGHEHFSGSLVVPVLDANGHVCEIYGRKIGGDTKLREGTPLHLYLPGPHRGVFNEAGLIGHREVILCEALLDALTFWCAGYRNVTSAFGVGGCTDDILAAFVTHGVQRVLIAYDPDAAGERAAEALVPKLATHGIAADRVLFPQGLDANAFALRADSAEQRLGVLLQQARPMGEAPARPALSRTAIAAEPMPLVADPIATPIDRAPVELPQDAPRDAQCATAAPTLVTAEVSDQQIVLVFGDRRYRVRGLAKNLSTDTLRVNMLASRDEALHVDTFDLYAAKARSVYIKQTASALSVEEPMIERDLARLLMQLEALQETSIRAAVTPKLAAATALPPEVHDAALALLRDPALSERIVRDVCAIGVVGEDSNALVGYLACVSRKLDKPLAVLIQSTSAAGKSTLMDALLALMPEPERVHYSAMTGQSLFYLGEGDLRHKILAIAEEEGVRQAAYALKLLQSQGELTIASTGKDPQTGKLVTEEYRVEGPVMLFLTSTAIDLDEELLNRCLVLTINESREQTAAIHRRQREARTLSGLVATKAAETLRTLHRAAQQLLRPVAVVNPYAEQLTFRSESTRMRRDHAKYLTLIDAIAFLHQHQRPIRTATVGAQAIEYVEVTLDDIALANRLANDVLGRSLDDLPPQTRRVLGHIVAFVEQRAQAHAIDRPRVRFSRRELREATGCGDTQLKLHLMRLEDHEYLIAHRQGQRHSYELSFDGRIDDASRQFIGLLDVEVLRSTTTNRSGQSEHRSGSGRSVVGVRSDPGRDAETPLHASAGAVLPPLVAAFEETPPLGKPRPMHRRPNGATAAL